MIDLAHLATIVQDSTTVAGAAAGWSAMVPFISGALASILMQLVKQSKKIQNLTTVQKQVLVSAIGTVLTVLNIEFKLSLPIDVSLLSVTSLQQLFETLFSAFGLYQLAKSRSSSTTATPA